MEYSDHISLSEAAQRLGLAPALFWHRCVAGAFPMRKGPGGQWYLAKFDYDRLVAYKSAKHERLEEMRIRYMTTGVVPAAAGVAADAAQEAQMSNLRAAKMAADYGIPLSLEAVL